MQTRRTIVIETSVVEYSVAGQSFEAFVARDPAWRGARAGVMVCHAWEWQDEFAREKARALAALGYVGFAADVYGKGRRAAPGNREQAAALMTPLVNDRAMLRQRLLTSLEAMRRAPGVDARRCAAIGYCFGGLCALDLARAGAEVGGVVALHGLLGGCAIPSARITARVLALHGWDDPMATPESVLAFAAEMREAGADWQLHAYGGTMHAFTNPAANDRAFGVQYRAEADRRSWAAMSDFLREVCG